MEEQPKTFWDIFKSRKFWVLALALVVATAAMATGKIDGWQYTQAVVIALAAYSTGVAIEDAGTKAGAGFAAGRSPAAALPAMDPRPVDCFEKVKAQPAPDISQLPIIHSSYPTMEDIYKIERKE